MKLNINRQADLINSKNLFRIILLLSFLGVLAWQISFVWSKRNVETISFQERSITFELSDGSEYTLPNSDDDYSLLVFWNLDSEQSLNMIEEAKELSVDLEDDDIVSIYLINLDDTFEEINAQLEIDSLVFRIGVNPQGSFIDDFNYRFLPHFVVINSDGEIKNSTEGFEKGKLIKYYQQVNSTNKDQGMSGLRFFDGATYDSGN